MDLARILAQVPDYKAFLTVDEMDAHTLALPARYPGVCSVFEAGKSQKGHPIYALKIGSGAKNAYIMGCPHPNEPIGAMMLEFLTDLLCRDDALREELGFTWYIVKTADPDGVKLNEGWFNGRSRCTITRGTSTGRRAISRWSGRSRWTTRRCTSIRRCPRPPR